MDTLLLFAFAPGIAFGLALVYALRSPSRVINKRLIILVVACVIAGIVAAGLIGPGVSFLFMMLSVAGFIPALLVGGVIVTVCKRSRQTFVIAVMGFSILLYISATATALVEMGSVQPYCNTFINNLEAFNSQYGKYPASLADVGNDHFAKPLKALLRGDDLACGYEMTKGSEYKFVIGMGGMGEYWFYQSKNQQWEYRR